MAVSQSSRRLGRWLPLLVIALVALTLILFLRPRAPQAAENITFERAPINNALVQFLGDSTQHAPKTFVIDDLYFEIGSALLTADSAQTVNNLAQVLTAYPTAHVQLRGHTDNTGSAEANQTLSLDRANSIKVMLVSQGVSADRLSTEGTVASNDKDNLRSESHGPDGDFASSLSATLDRANAQGVGQDRSVAFNDNDMEDVRRELHGPDGDFASSLSAILDRARNRRIELTVVSK
jgi:outer membrane protein OmpA-like peptidoglycan-associated protein